MNQAIFRSLQQAVYFSLLMEVLPATVKSSSDVLINSMMRSSGRVYRHGESSMNFSGLSPLEVRGQCAMVRAIIVDNLSEPQKHAIWAKCGVFDIAKGVRTMLTGIEWMRTYAEAHCSTKGDALLELLCNHYKLKESNSLRLISSMYDIDIWTLERDKKTIAGYTAGLELGAFSTLGAINKIEDLIISQGA